MENKLKKKIIEAVSDSEFLASPDMVIEEKKPFYWRFKKDWLEYVTERLLALIKAERKKMLKKLDFNLLIFLTRAMLSELLASKATGMKIPKEEIERVENAEKVLSKLEAKNNIKGEE